MKTSSSSADRSLGVYQRIAIGLFVVVIVVFIAIVYSVWVRARVVVILKRQSIPQTIVLSVHSVPTLALAQTADSLGVSSTDAVFLSGLFHWQDKVVSKLIHPQTKRTQEARAHGTIVVSNRSSHAQPLIKTTRFLNAQGVLFRLDESTVVPAGGTKTVNVTADQLGAAFEVGPGHWSIPGLWQGLQSQIDGASSAGMTGGVRLIPTMDPKEVAKAQEELVSAMRVPAGAEPPTATDRTRSVSTVAEKTVSTKTTDDGSVEVTVRAKILRVELLTSSLTQALLHQTNQRLSSDVVFAGFNRQVPLRYTVDRLDQKRGTLQVRIEGEVWAYPVTKKIGLNKSLFVGARRADAQAIAQNNPAVDHVDISTTPFWLDPLPNDERKIEFSYTLGQ